MIKKPFKHLALLLQYRSCSITFASEMVLLSLFFMLANSGSDLAEGGVPPATWSVQENKDEVKRTPTAKYPTPR